MTLNELLDRATPHPSGFGGKQVRIQYGDYTVSIVGGRDGLYGDLIETFEVAILKSGGFGEFVTKEIYPDAPEDILPWISFMDVQECLKMVEEKSSKT